MILLVLLLVVAAVLIGGGVTLALRLNKSRAAREDWLGELDDIRRDALTFDDALLDDVEPDLASESEPISEPETAPVPVPEPEPQAEPETAPVPEPEPESDSESEPEPEPEPEPQAEPETAPMPEPEPEPETAPVPEPEPASASARPAVESGSDPLTPDFVHAQGGRRFEEFHHGGAAITRLELGEASDSLRETAFGGQIFAVDLVEGSVWHRPAPGATTTVTVTVHIPAGWISCHGANVLVTSEPDGWCYVMCLSGACTVEVTAQGTTRRLEAGQVGRARVELPELQVADAQPDTVANDELLVMHRRLDAARLTEGGWLAKP